MYRGLSIRQPWANLVCDGRKTIEVRSWQTDYRGDLVICAGERVDAQAALIHDIDILPLGSTVCLVELIDIRPLQRSDAKAAMLASGFDAHGQFAWVLANPRPLKPIKVSGSLGIFGVSDSVVVAV